MNIVTVLIYLTTGAWGGYLAGGLLPNYSLGALGNAAVGMLGGCLGVAIAATTLDTMPGLTVGTVLIAIAGGSISGAVATAIIGFGKNVWAKAT